MLLQEAVLTEFVTKMLYAKNRRRGSSAKKLIKNHVRSSKATDTSQTRSRMSLEHMRDHVSRVKNSGRKI